MLLQSALTTVFHITATMRGTAFALEVDRRLYLVTARHVAETLQTEDAIGVHGAEGDRTLPVAVVAHTGADVTVLAPKEPIGSRGLRPLRRRLQRGEEGRVLGFPYSLDGLDHDNQSSPFVRRALVASVGRPEQEFFIDAIVNAGFSGSPVLVLTAAGWKVAGVAVSAYDASVQVRGPDGNPVMGLRAPYTSGLGRAWPIAHALQAIAARPVGLPV